MKRSAMRCELCTVISCVSVGFEPSVERSEATRLAIQRMFAFGPPVAFVVAIWRLSRFGLDAREHARIRAALDERT